MINYATTMILFTLMQAKTNLNCSECMDPLADLGGGTRPPPPEFSPPPQILSISCSFQENLAKLYVLFVITSEIE